MLASFLRSQPLIIILMGFSAVAMYGPMIVAASQENWLDARTFFYHGTFFLILTGLLGIPFLGRAKRRSAIEHLAAIFFAFLALPAIMAVPVHTLVGQLSYLHSYFEMLSSFTTTGASLIDVPGSVSDSIHFWRGLVGWMGGLMILVVALAIFAPLNIGGFEVYSVSHGTAVGGEFIIKADIETRIAKFTRQILPVYVFLTAILGVALVVAGERPLVGAMHAMAVLSTSGISPVGGIQGAQGGLVIEFLMFLFMFFAVSRFTFLQDRDGRGWKNFKSDKEINIALVCVVAIPLLLFLRHWTGAFVVDAERDSVAAFASLWGGVFTVLSFLTTTGFESLSWNSSRYWSGLETPGLIFIALAVMGGGVATTAGGVKLLRIYALFKHGSREMQKLRYPNSVGGSGKKARSLRREGAYIAWIFLMLFTLILAIVMLALSATGLAFENSLTLAVAGLSTTGPLLHIANDAGLNYSDISDPAKVILCAAMILGRMEALAVIALLNANYWRD